MRLPQLPHISSRKFSYITTKKAAHQHCGTASTIMLVYQANRGTNSSRKAEKSFISKWVKQKYSFYFCSTLLLASKFVSWYWCHFPGGFASPKKQNFAGGFLFGLPITSNSKCGLKRFSKPNIRNLNLFSFFGFFRLLLARFRSALSALHTTIAETHSESSHTTVSDFGMKKIYELFSFIIFCFSVFIFCGIFGIIRNYTAKCWANWRQERLKDGYKIY